MAEQESYWFELRRAHGIDEMGNLEPLSDIGIAMQAPQSTAQGLALPGGVAVVKIASGEALDVLTPARAVPDTRIVETIDHRIRDALTATGLFDRIGPPSAKHLQAARSETKAHRDHLKKRDEQVRLGHIPAPDASDHPPVDETPGQAPLVAPVFTADERVVIDAAIAGGSILSDEALAVWVTATSVEDIISKVGDDALYAKRVLSVERLSGRARKTLVDHLEHITEGKS